MTFDRYTVVKDKTPLTYEFVSDGIKGKVSKLVIYGRTNIDNVFNLAFGDKNEETGEIDDMIITNNGDGKKVLATVASTLYTFY